MEMTSSIGKRSLPHNIEAEEYLIASLLIDNDCYEKILTMPSKLNIEDFYDPRNQFVFHAIENLKKRNIPVDLITLTEELKNLKLLDKTGGTEYINGLLDKIPTSANIEYYAEIVKSKSVLRRLINICNETVSQSFEDQNEVQKLIEEAEKKIFDINQEKHSASITDIKSNLYEILERLSKSSSTAGEISGIPSGYYKLDEITDGFHGSELIVIAARPGMGKTSFGLNVACKAAVKHGRKIGIFSCEMSKESLVERILCSEASVDFSRMRKKMLKADEFDRLVHQAEKLYDTTLVFDDTPNIPILELRSKARRMVKDYNVDMIIIDYLQIITVEESMNRNPRHEQIGYISRSLKGLARELNLPLLVLAQLNREIESRSDDSGPKLSDLKDSGSIEQDADLILFIHKIKSSNDENQSQNYDTDLRQIIVGKNRFGPTGKIDMVFKRSFTRFEQLSKETEI